MAAGHGVHLRAPASSTTWRETAREAGEKAGEEGQRDRPTCGRTDGVHTWVQCEHEGSVPVTQRGRYGHLYTRLWEQWTLRELGAAGHHGGRLGTEGGAARRLPRRRAGGTNTVTHAVPTHPHSQGTRADRSHGWATPCMHVGKVVPVLHVLDQKNHVREERTEVTGTHQSHLHHFLRRHRPCHNPTRALGHHASPPGPRGQCTPPRWQTATCTSLADW